jgi:hypothetical protein
MPPLQALVALHGLWVLVFLPVGIWGAWKWPLVLLQVVGYTLCAAGLVALAMVIRHEMLTWYFAVAPGQRKYFGQRILFVLGTSTDFPVMQALLVGIVLGCVARQRKRGLPRDSLPRETRSSIATRIPLWMKFAYTAFITVLVPYYLSFYGPANFLWICDIALLLTVLALWLESRFLASMQLVAVLLPSLVWLADFLARLATGHFLTRWTHYMFRLDIPPIIRVLSLYHAWLPILLLWVVGRLGYDRRGWVAQTLLTWGILPICYFFTDPARALNGVFGPSGEHPQTWVPSVLWLAIIMIVYPVCVFFPTHLALQWLLGKHRCGS